MALDRDSDQHDDMQADDTRTQPAMGGKGRDRQADTDNHDEVTLVAPTGRRSRLREVLVGIDALAFIMAWVLALFVLGRANRDTVQGLLVVLGTTAIGLWLLSVQELYLARVSAIRSVE